jgi:ketosteroid isomerase-like protein
VDEARDTAAVVRRWFDALEQGDPAPELCDPEIEIRNWAEAPITGPYFGHEGVHRWWSDVADAFEDVRFELLELTPVDETRCVTVQRLVGRFRLTGIDVDGAWGAIVTVRDGKILSAVGYATPGRAKKAATALD